MNKKTTSTLIIIKTAMSGADYAKINDLLKQIQGEKFAPNIFKIATDKCATITDYLEKEKIIYETYTKNE